MYSENVTIAAFEPAASNNGIDKELFTLCLLAIVRLAQVIDFHKDEAEPDRDRIDGESSPQVAS
jgi:hypothetical protein